MRAFQLTRGCPASSLQEHPVLPYRVGLNRRTLDDESSIGAHTVDHGDSSTALNTFESFRPRNPF